MSSEFRTLLQYFEEFKSIFDQPHSLERCKDLMEKMKLGMTRFAFPGLESVSMEEEKKKLFLCREIVEYGILLSIKLKDIPSFERYLAQIKTYYYDYQKKYELPASSREYMILGLNLLRLLAQNKLAEFHTELELIPLEKHHDNVFIKHSVSLEQCMMEGAYHKVTKARSAVPAETYLYFMDMLMETVRNEIAKCSEQAFNNLLVSEAQKLLGFTDESQLRSYAESQSWKTTRVNGMDYFIFKGETGSAKKSDVPAEKVIKRSLRYAKELEKIV